MRAVLFPGQGAQAIGMGRDVAEHYASARAVFEEVDDALGEKLSSLIFEGGIETLTLTRNAQPALMAASIAILSAMREEGFDLKTQAQFVAGHSLGEYTALCAVGAIALDDTARLLRIRGDAMQAAVPVGEGAMAALLGADIEKAKSIAKEAAQGEICQAANDNDPSQVVISGHKSAIERAIEIAREEKVKRAVLLPVSAPFHCALMEPAARVMAQALDDVEIYEPELPVIANVTASPVTDPTEIRSLLVDQVTGSVRWRESVLYMASHGIKNTVEVGAGKALTGMVRRISPEILTQSVSDVQQVQDFIKTLGA